MPHLNRAVNDPLIDSNGYQNYSYFNPVVREMDLNKTLDLSSLRFSLDDFQKLSNGTYNAGELRLTDSGKLDIVNNHKTWTVFNRKTVDGADSFAIRVAFAKAMEAGGVDKAAMKDVRRALGLHSDYSMRGMQALEPLTRQEVRQLIDKNIGAINAHRSEGNKLQTYDQLHARYSQKELQDISKTRETINSTGSVPNIEINAELRDLLTVIKKNHSFKNLTVQDAEDRLEFIDELTTALECVQDQDARYDWVRENGTEYKVTVTGGATGMAIALDAGKVVVETITDGKRSRIPLGLTPANLLERLEKTRAVLSQIAVLDVDDNVQLGKAGSEETAPTDSAPRSKPKAVKTGENKIEQFETIRNDSDIKVSRQNIRRNDVPRDVPEIKEEPSDEKPEVIAKKNLDTLASLLAQEFEVEVEDVTEIIKQVDNWEWELSNCSTEGNPARLADVNEDLRNFLLNNRDTLDPLIKQAKADRA